MNTLATSNSERIKLELLKSGTDVSIGDQFVSDDTYQGTYFRIEGFYRHDEYGDKVTVRFGNASGWDEKTRDKSLDDFEQYTMKRAIPFTGTIAQMEADALASLTNVSALDTTDGEISEDDSTALIVAGGMDYCKDVQSRTRTQIERVESIRRIVKAKVNALSSIVSKMEREMKIIQKVVGALELYLGVYEEVVQIRIGEPAEMDAIISFRQQILYMDEEVGDPRKNPITGQYGIDFQSVDDFDAWVVSPENCDKMLPEEKGVVAIRPSRQERSYSKNPWINAKAQKQNQMCYLLCRNGDNLYRVWTSLTMGYRLFASPNEMELILNGETKSSSGWISQRDAKEKAFSYKQKALLLQGILDRTEIFLPMKQLVNLFDPDTYGGMIRFIYDDEPALQDGKHIPYKEWKAEINGAIGRGSRVLVSGFSGRDISAEDRFKRYYRERCAPPAPGPGIYTIQEVVRTKTFWNDTYRDNLYILYNPGDTIGISSWEYNPHTRKNRVNFALYRSDFFVLNYDRVSLADVEYYINCRFERRDYLKMIPVLWEIREQRMKEIKWEEMFIDLVAGRNGCDADTVRACVAWWKFKNIWKRPVREDDAKALRMIERKLERILDGKITVESLST